MHVNALTIRNLDLDANRIRQEYILVDGSGSMSDKWWDMVDFIDRYVATLQAGNLASRVTVNVFSDNDMVDLIQRDEDTTTWLPLRRKPIMAPYGGTALFDAINFMCRRLRDMAPQSCAILICTDGGENGSTHTDENQARALLDWCRAQGWSVVFVGCDFNNDTQARRLGATPDTNVGVQKRLLGEAARNIGEKRVKHANSGEDISFSDGEKSTFGGYLTSSPK